MNRQQPVVLPGDFGDSGHGGDVNVMRQQFFAVSIGDAHIRYSAADKHLNIFGAVLFGGYGAVSGNRTAADDGDVAVNGIFLMMAEIVGVSEGEFFTVDAEIDEIAFACGDNDAVKALSQKGRRILNRGVQPQVDAVVALGQKIPVLDNDFVRQTGFGNKVQRAADFIRAFKNNDFVSLFNQRPSGGNPGRAGADDGDTAVVAGRIFRLAAVFPGAVFFEQRCLNARNAQRRIEVAAEAGLHAEGFGANQAAGLPHRVIAADRIDSQVIFSFQGMGNEFLRAAVDRAGAHAGFGFAAQTA